MYPFFIWSWDLWQCRPLSHSGGVSDMTFQKVTVSFTISRVAYSGEGPSYNQPCILPCLSVLSKTLSPSQLQGHDFTCDPTLWPLTSLWRKTRTNFTQEDKKKQWTEGVTFCHTVLLSLVLKSGQTKVSLKNILRVQVKWGFWSGTLHVTSASIPLFALWLCCCVSCQKKSTLC